MPPFHPKAEVPVPAPTEPSATGPSSASSIARSTSTSRIAQRRMSLSQPSLVSPTTALTEHTSSLPGWRSVQSTTACTAVPTHNVLVSTIGVSRFPSSSTCRNPAALPKALAGKTAAGTFTWKTLPPWGTIAVTPVRMDRPSFRVTCPTFTPATSVMALSGPGCRIPGSMPSSRRRGRSVCWAKTVEQQTRQMATILRRITVPLRKYRWPPLSHGSRV